MPACSPEFVGTLCLQVRLDPIDGRISPNPPQDPSVRKETVGDDRIVVARPNEILDGSAAEMFLERLPLPGKVRAKHRFDTKEEVVEGHTCFLRDAEEVRQLRHHWRRALFPPMCPHPRSGLFDMTLVVRVAADAFSKGLGVPTKVLHHMAKPSRESAPFGLRERLPAWTSLGHPRTKCIRVHEPPH